MGEEEAFRGAFDTCISPVASRVEVEDPFYN